MQATNKSKERNNKMYTLLGTHNSATGEQPADLLSLLGAPVARCQTKTIAQQLEAGVRLFDLRVKPYRHATRYNVYYPLEKIQNCTLGHGLCDYNITLKDAVKKINDFGRENGRQMFVLVTFEGQLQDQHESFVGDVVRFVAPYKWTTLIEVNVKKPKWAQLWRNSRSVVRYTSDFAKMQGWRNLAPFPAFWHRFVKYPVQPEGSIYSLRDFV